MSFDEQMGTLTGWLILVSAVTVLFVVGYYVLRALMPFIIGVLIRLGVLK